MAYSQQDKTCAGAKHGHPCGDALAQGFEHSQLTEHFRLGGAFAAGQNQRVEGLFQVGRLAKLDALTSKFAQHALVLDKCPLNSQNGNGFHKTPLTSNKKGRP